MRRETWRPPGSCGFPRPEDTNRKDGERPQLEKQTSTAGDPPRPRGGIPPFNIHLRPTQNGLSESNPKESGGPEQCAGGPPKGCQPVGAVLWFSSWELCLLCPSPHLRPPPPPSHLPGKWPAQRPTQATALLSLEHR